MIFFSLSTTVVPKTSKKLNHTFFKKRGSTTVGLTHTIYPTQEGEEILLKKAEIN
jgi:hypothetical protein